jgi:hypothetical protein
MLHSLPVSGRAGLALQNGVDELGPAQAPITIESELGSDRVQVGEGALVERGTVKD